LSEYERRFPLLGSRVVWDLGKHVSIPSIGALAPGHLLVIPRDHITSWAQAEQDHQTREQALVAVRAVVESHFGPTVAFEHGSASDGSSGGCGITHAHVHIVPCRWIGGPPQRVVGLEWEAVDPKTWTLTTGLANADYLMFSPQADQTFLAPIESIPSQWLRQQVGIALGHNNWDWRADTAGQELRTTLDWMRSVETTTAGRDFLVQS
jgi:diadenosine tetraphosphate (Ap4A) HIT family hydrolase